ncbi:hypothetical protein NBRC116597_23750 [Phaeobacter sp. NW0010-22]
MITSWSFAKYSNTPSISEIAISQTSTAGTHSSPTLVWLATSEIYLDFNIKNKARFDRIRPIRTAIPTKAIVKVDYGTNASK